MAEIRSTEGIARSGLVLKLLRDSCDRPEELDRAVEAWRWGGAAGLAVLEEAWQPEGPDATRARTALSTGWEDEGLPELVVRDNRWTLSGRGLQLRYGRDGRWYPYRERSGTWWPAGPPAHDPVLALAELVGRRCVFLRPGR